MTGTLRRHAPLPFRDADIGSEARFCPQCGASLADATRSDVAPMDESQTRTLTATPGGADDMTGSSSIDGARFVAGQVLAGRYRIVGLLGRGDMGEVYRADRWATGTRR